MNDKTMLRLKCDHSSICKLCMQGLRRLMLFGFQSDARSLQQVPAVAQVSFNTIDLAALWTTSLLALKY